MSEGTQATILLVEDSPQLRQAASAVLQHSGYRVLEASDGHEALALARDHRISLVLLDLRLPGLTGADVLKGLRDEQATAQTPVLVWSASDAGDEGRRVREHRVTAYLVKSMTPLSLLVDLVDLTLDRIAR